jgi:thiamine-phosphate pyrophosphorylase
MSLPKLQYISQGTTPEEHLKNIQSACTAGIELVQLRLKNTPATEVLKIAKAAREITLQYQTRLIINDHYKIAKEVKADGVHLGKKDSCPSIARAYLDDWQIIGGTANTLEECKILLEKKVNYIGLGPFRFTDTKANLSPVIGCNGYASILKELKTKIPIIAIGGITLNDVPEILNTGIYGIATSGELTKDFNKISLFHALLQSAASQEQVWKMN